MGEFRMPSLGADMDAGTVLEWLVKPGDEVHKGDVVAVVDTDKAAVEVEVFEDGVVDRILTGPGQRVPVGTPLAVLSSGAATSRTPPAPAGTVPPAAVPPSPMPVAASPVASPVVRRLAAQRGLDLQEVPGTGSRGRITRGDVERATRTLVASARRDRSSPYARRLAAERGVTLGSVPGSGPGGAVRAADIRAAATGAARADRPASPADRRRAMRRAVGTLMSRSKREVPHFYLSTTVDVSRALDWLRGINRDRPVLERLLPTLLLYKAAACAAREVPEVNGFWLDDGFVPSTAVHLGIAISVRGGGLVAPAIHDADRIELSVLMAGLRDLVTRTRAGTLRGSELTDATITATNLGDLGVESVFGVIYPPQVALVGFGRVVERPWAVDGDLGVRPVVTMTLSADHRASDGLVGARYLRTVDRLLQHPEQL